MRAETTVKLPPRDPRDPQMSDLYSVRGGAGSCGNLADRYEIPARMLRLLNVIGAKAPEGGENEKDS